MKIKFTETGWEDYTYWQNQDKKTLKQINRLLEDIKRDFYNGIGKPEALCAELSGWWSRRIDEKNRILYRITDNGDSVEVMQCRGHYGDR